jgi:hypothetical protein
MSVAGAIGAVEAHRLGTNPALWASVVPALLWATFVGEDALGEHFLLSGYGVALSWFVSMVIVALAARRTAASGASALFDVLPSDAGRRTMGIGLAGVAAAGLSLVVTIVVWAWRHPGTILGASSGTVPVGVDVPRPNLSQFLQGPLVLVVFVGFGLVIGRWVPSSLVLPALVVPIAAQFVLLGVWEAGGTTWYSWLLPMASGWVSGDRVGDCASATGECVLPLVGFDTVTPWWHAAYLACVAGLLFTIATSPRDADRRRTMIAGGWLVGVVLFAAVQLAVYQRSDGVAQ